MREDLGRNSLRRTQYAVQEHHPRPRRTRHESLQRNSAEVMVRARNVSSGSHARRSTRHRRAAHNFQLRGPGECRLKCAMLYSKQNLCVSGPNVGFCQFALETRLR